MTNIDRVHITCGDVAASMLEKCGVSGRFLPWKDLLLIGPLPKLDSYKEFFVRRSQYIKDWTKLDDLPSAEQMASEDLASLESTLSAESIVFWIWPMLSNHTMLLCLLDWYRQNSYQGELLWVDASKELGRHDEDYIRTLIGAEQKISKEQLTCAESLWEALRQDSPQHLQSILLSETERFPHMNQALWRYLEELPGSDNGLSKLQQKVLEAIQQGSHSPKDIYKFVHRDEQYFIAGDWYLWHLIAEMIDLEFPLICVEGNKAFCFPPKDLVTSDFDLQSLSLSDIAHQVLAGQKCHISLNGNKRAWGGVDSALFNVWRFDSVERKVLFKAVEELPA